ncbi:MAG: efflux RND transporter permease subunit, partial [Kiloniellales bacterium]
DSATGRIGRVTLGDVADVSFGYARRTARMRVFGQEAVGVSVMRETGANVMETMEGIREAVKELNAFAVPNAGLKLEQHYDETAYIESAIDLVNTNIYVGGSLAAVILLLFLRSLGATLVISLAIPVSIVGAFVAMATLGRSINVISLAGLAFAIGMVVDAAIVVLENIYRLLEKGMPTREAAYRGAKEVWGAVLVSALTTVMVFVPILVMELEVGQLFRDIAVAISVAVMLSLLVSITVVPALARRLLGRRGEQSSGNSWTRIHLPVIDPLASAFVAGVMGFVRACTRSKALAIAVVATATVAAGTGAWMFLPKLEYLPEGNRNMVFGSIIPPPGYNLATTFDIAQAMEEQTKPLWASVSGPESQPGEPPKIQRFFFVATDTRTFLGAVASDEQRAGELIPVLQQSAFQEPGTFGFISQPSIFGRGVGSGRRIDIDISGPDLEADLELTKRIMQKAIEVMPVGAGNQYRPNPGLELGAPEVRVLPNRLRLADNGVSVRDFADTIDVFNDGARAAEVTVDNKRLDLVLQGPDRNVSQTQGIGNLPVVTSSGQILPASSLSDVILTSGPTEIRHQERQRTITLQIRPAAGIPLESAIEILQTQVLDPLIAEGLPPGVAVGMSGTADKLSETWDAMVVQLVLAVVIVYLVMAVLFESWIYPLVIMLAVPLAAAGGVVGLAVLNIFVYQPLDMLTLLGFVILVGIVVNNAILVVHQMLYHIREEDFLPAAAILEATRNRIRPIFMSTLTSVFGMLPLVVFPGAGSELYRGLGSVVVGGLMLSAILTMIIIPPMLSLVTDLLEGKARGRQPSALPLGGAAPQPAPGE